MSEIYIIWASNPNNAQARFEQLTDNQDHRVLRRDNFDLIQTEDLDQTDSLTSDNTKYCIIFELY
jgi:hypothetical protein